jgi:hypothetical protein
MLDPNMMHYHATDSDDKGATHSSPNTRFNNDSIPITRVNWHATDSDPHLRLISTLSNSEARKNW